MTTEEFILEHRLDDVRQLALRGCSDKSVDVPYALDQIAGWQTARKKLPTWAATDGIIYPPHLNMEQCSSEKTARYKQFSLTSSPSPSGEGSDYSGKQTFSQLIDLTGGFGVDFSFMSRSVDHAVYVERNERLCEIAKHNFQELGLKNVEVVCGDGVEYLKSLEPIKSLDKLEDCNHKVQISNFKFQSNHKFQISNFKFQSKIIFLDPARRDSNGHKVFGIEDCTPDVLALKDELLAKADLVMIKLSPMLDWHAVVKAFGSCCREVHIVSVDNECKEVIAILNNLTPSLSPSAEGSDYTVKLVCVNLLKDNEQQTVFNINREDNRLSCPIVDDAETFQYLFVPNASIMKAGCFAEVADTYGVKMLDVNSHLFVGREDIKNFPGRRFAIVDITTMNKKELKAKMKGLDKANISVRNFPLSVAELRKRLKLKDGGDAYLFATTVKGKHIILITHSV